MRLTRSVIASLLIAGLVGCMTEKRKRAEFFAQQEDTSGKPPKAKVKQSQPPPFTRAEAEDAIVEAVIVRFVREASQLKPVAEAIFVGFTPANADPNPGYLKRFEKLKTPVFPISSAARVDDGGWIDKASGKRGVVLRIERIDWDGFYAVRVPYVWAANAGNEHAAFFPLVWKRGRWVVQFTTKKALCP